MARARRSHFVLRRGWLLPLAYLLAGLLSRGSASAGDLEFWPSVEYTLLESGRLRWRLEGSGRLSDGVQHFYDRRLSTLVETGLKWDVRIAGGYVLRSSEFPGFGFQVDHRFVGGASFPLWRGQTSVTAAVLYERHLGRPGIEDFNRYRQRIEIERGRGKLAPFLYEDLTFQQREGFVRSRSRAGLRWRFSSGRSLAVSYQFEANKQQAAWRPRHAIVTALSISRARPGNPNP